MAVLDSTDGFDSELVGHDTFSGSGESLLLKGDWITANNAGPVLLYFPGTDGIPESTAALSVLLRAASVSMVAVSVDYDSSWALGDCDSSDIPEKAEASITEDPYDGVTSVVEAVCAKEYADCNRIYVMGHSQGGAVATLAADYNANVLAAVTMGTVPQWIIPDGDKSACMDAGNRVLPEAKLRALVGEHDRAVQGGFAWNLLARKELNDFTGKGCATQAGVYDCLDTDGSGWYIVPDSLDTGSAPAPPDGSGLEIGNSSASHSFFVGGNDGSGAGDHFAVAIYADEISAGYDPLLEHSMPWWYGCTDDHPADLCNSLGWLLDQ